MSRGIVALAVAVVSLLASGCDGIPIDRSPDPTPAASSHAYVAAGSWSHSGGPGSYPSAEAACKGFADTYDPPWAAQPLEDTKDPAIKRCWVKPKGDPSPATVVTLVMQDDVPKQDIRASPDPGRLREMTCAVRDCDQVRPSAPEMARLRRQTPQERCRRLGAIKHACVEERLAKSTTGLRAERSFDMDQDPPAIVRNRFGDETVGYIAAKRAQRAQHLGTLRRPDAVADTASGYEVYDAKFPCSQDLLAGRMDGTALRSDRNVRGIDRMSDKEIFDYQAIADAGVPLSGPVTAIAPADATGVKCP